MPAPVLLVIEVEQPEGLSTRKLVLETAKFNVITAYSGADGLAYLEQFPNVNAIVVHSRIRDMSFQELLAKIREHEKHYKVCLVTPDFSNDSMADAAIPSREPEQLLELLRSWTTGVTARV